MRAPLEHTAGGRADTHDHGNGPSGGEGQSGGGGPSGGDGTDPLLAVQLSDRPRYDTWPGAMRLALAVVEDAILTVRTTTGVRSPRAQRLAAEAWAWLASRDTRHPYAFENLCDYLDLSAAWLRNGLRLAGYGTTTPRAERPAARAGQRPAPRARAHAG